MKRAAFLTALMFGSLLAAVCYAAPQQGTTPSLGELARQMRAQREKEASKPAKEYTNDNLPKSTGLSSSDSSAEGGKASGGEGSEAAPAGGGKSKSGVHDEKYYHEQMAELQSQKEMHQRELDVLEKKLSQAQMQYYPDPQKALQEQYTREDINKKTGEIEKKKKQIEADDKAIADLEQQCQREGCPAGWLR